VSTKGLRLLHHADLTIGLRRRERENSPYRRKGGFEKGAFCKKQPFDAYQFSAFVVYSVNLGA
jgi:hypothetical protein